MSIDRAKAVRLHIAQDPRNGHWMESFEMPDGKLYLTKWGIEDPDPHDIEDAKNPDMLASAGYRRSIEVCVSSARIPVTDQHAATPPKPRKAW